MRTTRLLLLLGFLVPLLAGAAHAAAHPYVAGLPWAFEVTQSDTPPLPPLLDGPEVVARRSVSFKSKRPISPRTYLRADVLTLTYRDAAAAEAARRRLLAGADKNTGLSYAWDELLQTGATLHLVSGPCLWSRASFRRLVENVRSATGGTPAVQCVCGGGCQPTN